MLWFAILVVGGYVVYVLRPDERRRVLAAVVQRLTGAAATLRRHRGRREPDAFEDAIRSRVRAPYLTIGIVALNAGIFLLMLTGDGRFDDPGTLVRWGGSLGPLTANGEWWRLLTATFVHAGVVQFLIDIVALTQAALLVERVFGHVALAGVYLTSAVLAGTIGVSAEPLAVGAGACAPVFALYGVLVALTVRGTVRRTPLTVPMRVLRSVAPVAAIFVLYYMWADGAAWTSGLATFVIGFGIGLALTRHVAERTPEPRRVLPLAMATLTIATAIVAPLKGMTDVRSELARLFTVEDHTAARYRAATDQFTRGTVKAEVLAQLIERSIVPELEAARRQLKTVTGVPRQQQPLVGDADTYLRLRAESWLLRAAALHRSSMRLLREADQKERVSIAVLEKIRPAVEAQGG